MSGLEDREVVVWVLGAIVTGFAFASRRKLRTLPHWRLPIAAASLLLVGWTFSIVETWYAPAVFNVAEHAAYVAHSLLMLVWVAVIGRANARPATYRRQTP